MTDSEPKNERPPNAIQAEDSGYTRITNVDENLELGIGDQGTGEVKYPTNPVDPVSLPSDSQQLAKRDAHIGNLEAKNFGGGSNPEGFIAERSSKGLDAKPIADPAEGDEPWVLRDLTGGDPNDDPAESNQRRVQIAHQNDAALEFVSGQEPPIDPNDHDSLQLVGRYKDNEEDDSSQSGSLWKRFRARLDRSR